MPRTKKTATPSDTQGVSGEILLSYIERIERLEEEKAAIAEGIRDVFLEAKGNGFDVPAMRELLKLRKMDSDDADERETILDIYKRAIGME